MRIFLLCLTTILFISCGGDKSSSSASNSPQKATESSESKLDPMTDGKKIYDTYCVACHGQDGKLQLNGAKDLSISELDRAEKINQVTNGKGLMTPYKGILSPEEIDAVVDYTFSLKQ